MATLTITPMQEVEPLRRLEAGRHQTVDRSYQVSRTRARSGWVVTCVDDAGSASYVDTLDEAREYIFLDRCMGEVITKSQGMYYYRATGTACGRSFTNTSVEASSAAWSVRRSMVSEATALLASKLTNDPTEVNHQNGRLMKRWRDHLS